jgi:type II secretory pathway component PulF
MRTGLMASLRISEVLKLAGEASQSAVLRAGASRAARLVEEGSSLNAALRTAGGFPATFVNSVEMAEKAGMLDVEMSRWMTAEMEMAARAQDRLAEWLPRAVYFIIMLWIAYRIISTFSDYFGKLGDITRGVGM